METPAIRANSSKGSTQAMSGPWAFAFLIAGLAMGFLAGRFPHGGTASRGTVNIPASSSSSTRPAGWAEQTGVLRNIRTVGTFDTFYAQSFASPPALEIIDDHDRDGWSFRVAEQRADGFKLEINAGGGRLNEKPLRYAAKGTRFDGMLLVQEGEELVPTARDDQPGETEIFYRTPFPSPPQLSFPSGLEGCRVKAQTANGFKLHRYEGSGLVYQKVKWRAELAIRKEVPAR